ncbi:MAG: sensor domain-containing diguanylate cyclase [bacterium]
MRVGLGYSVLKDPYQAGKEAAREAVLVSGDPVITFLFTTYYNDPEALFKGVKENVRNSKIIGASNEYIIVYDRLISKGVGVLSISGSEITADTYTEENIGEDAVRMGEQAGRTLLNSGIDKGILVILFARRTIDIYELLSGLYNVIGPSFRYVGGGYGKDPKSKDFYSYTDDGISKGPINIALIGGLEANITLGHGFSSMKDPLIITRTSGNRIIEIDGMPASDVYLERLSDNIDKDLFSYMVLHPLGFPSLAGEYLIRDPIKLNSDKSISFATKIHKGSVGYIMKGNVHHLIESSRSIAKKAVRGISGERFSLVFDCISRYSLMGDRFKLELEAIRDSIGLDVPMIGMLTWGEIGGDSSPVFHNKTTVIVVGGKKEELLEDYNNDKEVVTPRTLNIELSILHEIASFSFSGSRKGFGREVIEKTKRLLGVKRSALLEKVKKGYRLSGSWGFQDVKDVLENSSKESPNQLSFLLGEEGRFGLLYLEKGTSISNREKRIYTIFARRVEDIFMMIDNIIKIKRTERALRKLALKDELTKLYNRRGFLTLGEQHLRLSERLKRKSILLYIDVDNLKWINDNLGHNEGDKVLIEVSLLLKRAFRKSDIIARIGGDEFVVLGLETSDNNEEKLKKRLEEKVEDYNRRRHLYNLSLSIGVVSYDPSNPISLKTLLEEADRQMYLEKRNRKG